MKKLLIWAALLSTPVLAQAGEWMMDWNNKTGDRYYWRNSDNGGQTVMINCGNGSSPHSAVTVGYKTKKSGEAIMQLTSKGGNRIVKGKEIFYTHKGKKYSFPEFSIDWTEYGHPKRFLDGVTIVTHTGEQIKTTGTLLCTGEALY
jgi:hypothetical protein